MEREVGLMVVVIDSPLVGRTRVGDRARNRRRQEALDLEVEVAEVDIVDSSRQGRPVAHLGRGHRSTEHGEAIRRGDAAHGEHVETGETHETQDGPLGGHRVGVWLDERLLLAVHEDGCPVRSTLVGTLDDQQPPFLEKLAALEEGAGRVEHVVDDARAHDEVERSPAEPLDERADLDPWYVLDIESERVAGQEEPLAHHRVGGDHSAGSELHGAEADEPVDGPDVEDVGAPEIDVAEQIHGPVQRDVLRFAWSEAAATGELAKVDGVEPTVGRDLVLRSGNALLAHTPRSLVGSNPRSLAHRLASSGKPDGARPGRAHQILSAVVPDLLRSLPGQRWLRPMGRSGRRLIRGGRRRVARLRWAVLGHGDARAVRSELATLRHDRLLDQHRLTDIAAALQEVGRPPDEFAALVQEAAANAPVVEDRLRQLTALVDGLRSSVHTLLGPAGRHVSRLVSDEELELLISELEFVERPEAIAAAVHQAYRTLVELELRCVGRLAGSTLDVVAELAAIALLPPPTGELLVIGTNCGVEAVGAARQLLRVGRDPHLTVVDAFTDHHPRSGEVPATDVSLTPSTPAVVRANVGLGGGVASDHVRVIEGTPDAPDTRLATGDRRYGLVVIGADRSDADVERDLVWIGTIVEPDALIVVNGAGDPSWPEVGPGLDRYLAQPGATLRLVGTVATSALLRAT